MVLNTQPTANVTIALSSSDTTEGTVGPASLVFTTANWNDGADGDGDGRGRRGRRRADQAYTIVTAAAVSTDPNYNSAERGRRAR